MNVMQQADDLRFMALAMEEARKAADAGEIPVGAVLVKNNEVIARAGNRRESDRDALAHAEILCIREACRKSGSWRLSDCTLYVTLEPCPMCAGAVINARIPRVVFACKDAKAGSFGSLVNLAGYPYNHKPQLTCGPCGEEAAELLSGFFRSLRVKRDDTSSR